jgi:hypothetical protein
LEEAAISAGHKVLMEADDNISMIVGGPQGILDEQFRPRIIHLLNIFIVL